MLVDASKIIDEYLTYASTGDIAKKYSLHKSDVKLLLRNALPKKDYLRLAHTIGAKKVANKLKNQKFREDYSKKMKKSVSCALTIRMRDEKFRKSWKKKAKLASVKGNKKIRSLLKNPDFSASWSKRCSLAAQVLKKSKKGIFDPSLKSERKEWSIAGLKNTGTRIRGPRGKRCTIV